jgi:hypothetical protein
MGCKQSLDIPASADPALRLLRGTRDKDFAHLSALKTKKIKKRHLILLRKEEYIEEQLLFTPSCPPPSRGRTLSISAQNSPPLVGGVRGGGMRSA